MYRIVGQKSYKWNGELVYRYSPGSHYKQASLEPNTSRFTFLSPDQPDLKAAPARFLRVQDHDEVRTGREEGCLHPLCVTPVHSSALAVRSKWTVVKDGQCAGK